MIRFISAHASLAKVHQSIIRVRRGDVRYLRLPQTGTRSHHEWFKDSFPFRIESRIRSLEPPTWIEDQGIYEIQGREVSRLLRNTYACLYDTVSNRGH